MIEYIKGILMSTGSDYIVVERGGMGYKILTSSPSIHSFSNGTDEIMVYTQLIVREDSMTLCGFSTEFERKVFSLLTSVSGIGMKVALAALSDLGAEQIIFAISCGDDKSLTKISGVGKKTAQRMVLELKDKIDKVSDATFDVSETAVPVSVSANDNYGVAVQALLSLGYSDTECKNALAMIDKQVLDSSSAEDLISMALKNMAIVNR